MSSLAASCHRSVTGALQELSATMLNERHTNSCLQKASYYHVGALVWSVSCTQGYIRVIPTSAGYDDVM